MVVCLARLYNPSNAQLLGNTLFEKKNARLYKEWLQGLNLILIIIRKATLGFFLVFLYDWLQLLLLCTLQCTVITQAAEHDHTDYASMAVKCKLSCLDPFYVCLHKGGMPPAPLFFYFF